MSIQPRNIIEKIWDAHIVVAREGYPTLLGIDLQMVHEVTSAQAFQTLRDRDLKALEPERTLATIDHSVPTRLDRHVVHDDMARLQIEAIRRNTSEFGIPLADCDSGDQGVVHVIGPELGVTQPGMTIVCGDSHTATHGAFGALAFGIGTTEVSQVLATGCLLQQPSKTMRVEFTGSFQPGVYSKDAILALIAEIGIGGGNGHVIEYTGVAIRGLSMEQRMTICNMSIECGARAGLIAPDETTFAYLKGRRFAPTPDRWEEAVALWRETVSDPGATYDREVKIDLDALTPMVTWGTNPEQAAPISGHTPVIEELPETHQLSAAKALAYTKLEPGQALDGVPIQWGFVGSCTNGRIEDLRIAADVLKGKRVHEGVTLYIVPGSEGVKAQAEKEGLDQVFIEAGASWRMPGCSMCLAMNDDQVPPGARCVSSSNRNFMGRQGPDSITHLASPATVAASAIAGAIASPSAQN